MPIYEFQCDECKFSVEKIQAIGDKAPACPKCGGAMLKACGSIAILRMFTDSGYNIHSKGYKEGYKKEYLKSKGQEAWNGTIVEEPQAQGKP